MILLDKYFLINDAFDKYDIKPKFREPFRIKIVNK